MGGGQGLSFGGGRAGGGSVAAGTFYEVNERGPELLTTGGRTS
jgi:SLT domain-containing protein